MGEYGSGVSLVQAFNYDKERLLKALDGQLLCGEDENGFIYEDATEEECREFIISVFDNAVYHALQGYQSGRIQPSQKQIDYAQKLAEIYEVDLSQVPFTRNDYAEFIDTFKDM